MTKGNFKHPRGCHDSLSCTFFSISISVSFWQHTEYIENAEVKIEKFIRIFHNKIDIKIIFHFISNLNSLLATFSPLLGYGNRSQSADRKWNAQLPAFASASGPKLSLNNPWTFFRHPDSEKPGSSRHHTRLYEWKKKCEKIDAQSQNRLECFFFSLFWIILFSLN